MLWVMKTIPTPRSLIDRIDMNSCCFSSGVTVAVGSSRIISFASRWSPRAISTICFWAAPRLPTITSGRIWKL